MTTTTSVSATKTASAKFVTTFLKPAILLRNNNNKNYNDNMYSNNFKNQQQQQQQNEVPVLKIDNTRHNIFMIQYNNNNNIIRNERRRRTFLSLSSSTLNDEDIDRIQDNTDLKEQGQQSISSLNIIDSFNTTCTINVTTTTTNNDDDDWEYNNRIAKSVFNITLNINNNKPIFLFDGICQFCNFGVHFCIDHDPNFHLRYASLQSIIGKSILISYNKNPNDISSLIVVTSNTIYNKSDAVLYIIELLDDIPKPIRIISRWCHMIIPKSIRDSIYNIIAKNRHNIGIILSDDTCRIDLDSNRFVQDP